MSKINVWLRKKEKLVIVIVCCIIMVVWFGGPQLFRMLASEKRPGGELFGEAVSRAEFQSMARRLYYIQQRRVPESFVVAQAWETLLLKAAAHRNGIRATDAEVLQELKRQFPDETGEDVDLQDYAKALDSLEMTQADFERTLRDRLTADLLETAIVENVSLSREEAWLWYARENQQVKTRYIQLKAEDLTELVEVNDEEIRAFYKEHENTPPAPGQPGYQTPQKVQIEYIKAPYERFAEKAEIGEEEIGTYYDENKEQFRLPADSVEEASPEEEDSPANEGAGEEAGGEATVESDPETVEGDSDEPANAPMYEPLEEVRDEIIETLRNRKSRELAEAYMREVDEHIARLLEAPETGAQLPVVDFTKLGQEFDLEYHRTRFFARDEVQSVISGPGAFRLAEIVFAEGASSLRVPKAPLKADDGVFIFQVLESRPAQPAPFEDVKEQVRTDLKLSKAMKLAQEMAVTASQAQDLDEAVEMVRDLLAQRLEASDSGKSAAELYSVGETPFFGRSKQSRGYDGRVMRYHLDTGLPGAFTNYYAYADAAFALKDGQIGVAAGPPDLRTMFVVQRDTTRAALRDEFEEEYERVHQEYLFKKRDAVLRSWRSSLLRRARPSKDVMQYLSLMPGWF